MGEVAPRHDFLLVSDLHVSLGYDAERRAYHAREDFFFDEAFFRWLRWADENCAPGRRWELVFVGDAFDFLPIDLDQVQRYFEQRRQRWQELDPADRQQVADYWQRQFGRPEEAPAGERAPDWVQWIFFEDDVAAGRVRLEPVSRLALTPSTPAAPGWAVQLYGALHPTVLQQEQEIEPGFALQRAGEEPTLAFRVAEGRGETLRSALSRQQEEAFERRYGFLPTQGRSMARLAFIYRGHPVFFRALAWFVGQGHRVTFIRGNHDLELFWPGVQSLLRAFVAREMPAALEQPSPSLLQRAQTHVDFEPGCFAYRPGLFYAEHGCQYEPIDSCPNFIRPLLPADKRLLNPPVGSLGVTTVVANMEDEYPEWENRGQHGVVLLELLRRYPHQAFLIVSRHVRDYLWMAQRLWQATKGQSQRPSEADFERVAQETQLPLETVKEVYWEWDPPLMVRKGPAWLLFSPGGHVVKALLVLLLLALAAGGALWWYLVAAPFLAGLIPVGFLSASAGPALQLLSKIALWILPPLALEGLRRRFEKWYPEPLMYWAAHRVHRHIAQIDPDLRFYILGHDHTADVRLIERRHDRRHIYYLNTGCWFPEFAEGARRLQTLGREVEFTFVQLRQEEDQREAKLLRWNDDAGRAERPVVPLTRPSKTTSQRESPSRQSS